MTTSSKSQSAMPHSMADWLVYLESLHLAEIELGLARISEVLQRLNLDLASSTIITVAGTNGKGTTSAMMEALLLADNNSTAVFSSPHIHRYNERLRINGEELPDALHVEAFEVVESARGDTPLTYFEFSTLACFWLVAKLQPKVAIIEVGLGGRLDSTNVLDPDIAVITTVDLDHQDWLGNDRETIGFEKAGIFRQKRPAIVGDLDMPNSVAAHAKALDCDLQLAQQDFGFEEMPTLWYWWHKKRAEKLSLPLPAIPVQNASTALAVLHQAGLLPAPERISQVCTSLQVPGRWQKIADQPVAYCDVAHNPQAARYLVSQIEKIKTKGQVRAVFACMKDKDIDTLLQITGSHIDAWYLGQLDMPRAASNNLIQEKLKKVGNMSVSCFDNVELAYKMAKHESRPDDIIIIFGSFFTVAEILDESI